MKFQPVNGVFQTLLVLGIINISTTIFAADEAIRLSEPVAVTDTYEVFGAVLAEQGTPMSLGELINQSDKYQDQEVLVETRIAKVCQKKGCFFVATEGAASARISFKDYSFFIPTDSGGKDVLLSGTFSRTTVSAEQAEHFAKDMGETAAASPEDFQYSIVATAVQIPRS